MADAPLRRIKSVAPRPGFRLAVAWERGPAVIVDLSEMISKGGVFADLADKNAFSAVRIGENNRVVEWPWPKDDLGYPLIEIDADALYEKSQEQQDKNLASSMRRLVDAMRPLRNIAVRTSKS